MKKLNFVYDNRIYYANPIERRFKVSQQNDSKCYKRLIQNVLTDWGERLFWRVLYCGFSTSGGVVVWCISKAPIPLLFGYCFDGCGMQDV